MPKTQQTTDVFSGHRMYTMDYVFDISTIKQGNKHTLKVKLGFFDCTF